MPQNPSSVGDTLVKNLSDDLSLKKARDAVSGAVDKAKSYLGFGDSTPKPDPDAARTQAMKIANDAFAKRVQDQRNAAPVPAPKVTPKKPLPKYEHGTDYVPKTGPAILHKGEAVLTKEEAAAHRASKTGAPNTSSQPHSVSLHRALAHLNKGGLHRALGVAEGQPIPKDKLEAAKHSDNPHIAHMAHFAATMEGFHHK